MPAGEAAASPESPGPEAAASPAAPKLDAAALPAVAAAEPPEPAAAASPASPAVEAAAAEPPAEPAGERQQLQREARLLLARQKSLEFLNNQLIKTTFANQQPSNKADLKSQVDEADAVYSFSIFMRTFVAAVHVACVRDRQGAG